ncbi:MAG TPA: helix-turn-helix domain-containing protein [Pyrinomonadaceae bacterium]|nr:helix-turn-helix domain-containing protein [Pyrinomonadaceae bacterium]
MSSTLGEKMRQAREERGISISEVAEQTRISPLYLESIEKDDYKPLPGGIFNKGFLKSYARYIGYDEHEALQEYSTIVATAEQAHEEEFKSYRPEVLTDDRSGVSIVPTLIFAGVILAMMTAGILLLVRYMSSQPETNKTVQITNVNGVNSAAVPSETNQPVNNTVPAMDALKVEFRTASSPISVSSISDGKSAVLLIMPDKPAMFEPKQALRLAYSKSLASSARLTMNGREISLPQTPANPKRAAIEVEINSGNIANIWQNGTVEAYSPQAAAPVESSTSTPAPRPKPKPSTTPAAANTTAKPAAKPSVPPAAAPRSTPH